MWEESFPGRARAPAVSDADTTAARGCLGLKAAESPQPPLDRCPLQPPIPHSAEAPWAGSADPLGISPRWLLVSVPHTPHRLPPDTPQTHGCLLTFRHLQDPAQALLPPAYPPPLPRPKSYMPGVYIVASCGLWAASFCIMREGVRYADTMGPIPILLNQNLHFNKTTQRFTSLDVEPGSHQGEQDTVRLSLYPPQRPAQC